MLSPPASSPLQHRREATNILHRPDANQQELSLAQNPRELPLCANALALWRIHSVQGVTWKILDVTAASREAKVAALLAEYLLTQRRPPPAGTRNTAGSSYDQTRGFGKQPWKLIAAIAGLWCYKAPWLAAGHQITPVAPHTSNPSLPRGAIQDASWCARSCTVRSTRLGVMSGNIHADPTAGLRGEVTYLGVPRHTP